MKRATSKASRAREVAAAAEDAANVSRILVGVRMEPRLVKVMKGLAELHECALGELLERVFWNAMEGGNFFAERNGKLSAETRQQIENLKQVYGVDYNINDLLKPRDRKGSGANG